MSLGSLARVELACRQHVGVADAPEFVGLSCARVGEVVAEEHQLLSAR